MDYMTKEAVMKLDDMYFVRFKTQDKATQNEGMFVVAFSDYKELDMYMKELRDNNGKDYKGNKILSYGQAWEEDLEKITDITFLKADSTYGLVKGCITFMDKEQLEGRTKFKKDIAEMILESNGDNDLFFEKYKNKYGVYDSSDKKEFKKCYDLFKEDIKNKDFFGAYMLVKNAGSPLFNDTLRNLDFMRAVVKEHGTNQNILTKAIKTVEHFETKFIESPEFDLKLLNATKNTKEYKKALDKEQGKIQTNDKAY